VDALYRLPGDTLHLEYTLALGELITAVSLPPAGRMEGGRRAVTAAVLWAWPKLSMRAAQPQRNMGSGSVCMRSSAVIALRHCEPASARQSRAAGAKVGAGTPGLPRRKRFSQ
jgi:hypothetical protein